MTVMNIHITARCNQNCLFCKRPPDILELKKKDIKNRILDAKKAECETVFFTGGEPTLRNDLQELIFFTKSLGVRAEILTNGLMLSYKEYLEKLRECGLDGVCISMQTHRSEVAETLSRKKGSLELQLKALDNLKEKKVEVTMNTVISSYNHAHLKDFVAFISKKYPNVYSFDFLLTLPEGNALKNKDVLVRLSDMKESLQKLMIFCRSKNIHFTVEFVPFCYMSGFEKHMLLSCDMDLIDVAGVDGCCLIGDYFKVGDDIENSKKIKYEYIRPEKCKTCSKYKICPGLHSAYAGVFGIDEVMPF